MLSGLALCMILLSCDASGQTLKGAALAYRNSIPDDWMYIAISRNDMHIVQQLIDGGTGVNSIIEPTYGIAPLSVAAYYGRHEIAKYLIEKGANVNQTLHGKRTPTPRTALLRAIWKKQNKVAILLLEHGADPTITTKNGLSACEYARRLDNFEIMPHLPNCS
jgi:ankyrin repeat protein